MLTYNNLWLSTIRSGKGDCLHIRFIGESGKPRNVIIDTGTTSTSGEFRKLYGRILSCGEIVDALFVTHYDDDHIGGILKLTQTVRNLKIGTVYLNAFSNGLVPSAELSAMQNQKLFHALLPSSAGVCSSVVRGQRISLDGAVLTVIAPSTESRAKALQEMERAEKSITTLAAHSDWNKTFDELMECDYPNPDTSVSNQSSIVMIFEYADKRFLLCGDAPAKSIEEGLQLVQNRAFDLVKLPHHGSIRNLSDTFLKMITSDAFLICADGASHPSKQTISKLIRRFGNVKVYSNYAWWLNGFLQNEDQKYIQTGKLSFMNIN